MEGHGTRPKKPWDIAKTQLLYVGHCNETLDCNVLYRVTESLHIYYPNRGPTWFKCGT